MASSKAASVAEYLAELPADRRKDIEVVRRVVRKNLPAGFAEKKLKAAFEKAGKKLDMGKSCLRFKAAGDLPLDVIGKIVASRTPKEWIAIFESSRRK